MTQHDPQLLRQLAALPADHPERQAFEATLAAADPGQRAHWAVLTHETDLLTHALADVEPPVDLANKLLMIPLQTQADLPATASRPKFHFQIWQIAAAILVLFSLVGIYLYLNQEPPYVPPTGLALADLAPADQNDISMWAVKTQDALPAPLIESNNLDDIKAKLNSHQFAFPVVMLHPPPASVQVQSGGICDFKGTPAIYTRWQSGGLTYTLYQMDTKAVKVPAAFKTVTVPADKSLWKGDNHYQVAIWAGGPCTWALVMQNESAKNPFAGIYY